MTYLLAKAPKGQLQKLKTPCYCKADKSHLVTFQSECFYGCYEIVVISPVVLIIISLVHIKFMGRNINNN